MSSRIRPGELFREWGKIIVKYKNGKQELKTFEEASALLNSKEEMEKIAFFEKAAD